MNWSTKRARADTSGYGAAGRVMKPTQRFCGRKPRSCRLETNETGDEQRRPREQGDRECHLRADQNLAEPLLPHAAARAAAALLQSIDQIGARTLPCRIGAHGKPGKKRKAMAKASTGNDRPSALPGFKRKKIRRQFWNERDELPRQHRAGDSGERAHEQTFENEESQHARARRTEGHAQRNLAPSAAEPDEEQIRHVAAGDEQDEGRPRRGEFRMPGAGRRSHLLAASLQDRSPPRRSCPGSARGNFVRAEAVPPSLARRFARVSIRPITRRKPVPRIMRSYEKPAMTKGFVVQTSFPFGPTHGAGMLGNTPTIVCATPSSVMLRPSHIRVAAKSLAPKLL